MACIFLAAGCRWPFSDVKNDFKFSGTLEMTEHSLSAKIAGRISAVNVKEGDTVQRGQLIAVLDRYDQAKKDLDRSQQLLKQGGATQQQVEHQMLTADDFTVTSPIDGVVLLKIHQEGEVVAAGSPLAIVGNPKDLWIRVFVPENKINRVDMNAPVEVRLDGLEQIFKGHVSFISPRAEFTPRNIQTPEERITQTFAVKVTLDDSGAGFHPGVAADVKILIKDAYDQK